jgi:hypothetical protein
MADDGQRHRLIFFFFSFTTWKLEIESKSGLGFFFFFVFSFYRLLLLLLLGSLPFSSWLKKCRVAFIVACFGGIHLFLQRNYLSALSFFSFFFSLKKIMFTLGMLVQHTRRVNEVFSIKKKLILQCHSLVVFIFIIYILNNY